MNFLLIMILLEFNIYFFLVSSILKDSLVDYLNNQKVLYSNIIKCIVYLSILIIFGYIYSEFVLYILLLYFFYFFDNDK
jgi:hypothetical protein